MEIDVNRPLHLLEALSAEMELEKERILMGEQPVEVYRVKDIEALWEELLAKGDDHEDVKDERIPYWADLWPSAIGMSEYLLKQSWDWKGKKVLELGCGLGLSGVAAGFLGGDVLMTDYLPAPLKLAELNWRINHDAAPQCQILDWRNPDPAMASDILLASDVAYEARSFEPLIAAFKTLLKPSGKIILSEPGRQLAKTFTDSFEQAGFQAEVSVIPVEYRGMITKVRVYEMGM